MSLSSVIIIPARFDSKRLPGKPLLQINSVSLIRRVYSIARSVSNVERVIIATDSKEIEEHCKAFKAEVVMTSAACRNGSERVFEAAKMLNLQGKILINLQGDAVLTPPWLISDLANFMAQNQTAQFSTLAVKLEPAYLAKLQSGKTRSGTFVTFSASKRALYFSRALIPNVRDADGAQTDIYKHIGIYAYRFEALKRYVSLEPTPLELAEKLEQLRALENDMQIDVVVSDLKGRTAWSVDTADDAKQAEQIIAQEGELVSIV